MERTDTNGSNDLMIIFVYPSLHHESGGEADRKSLIKRRFWKFSCVVTLDVKQFSGGNRERETPEPIPNSAVKPLVADGTIRKSMGE